MCAWLVVNNTSNYSIQYLLAPHLTIVAFQRCITAVLNFVTLKTLTIHLQMYISNNLIQIDIYY